MNLAYILRPKTLSEFVGQNHLVGKDKLLFRAIESGDPFSMILWGPPGSGKTTLANIIAANSKLDFFSLSAVESGKDQLRAIVKTNKSSLLFIDEIHRWTKAQQDALLPYVESGQIILIGATTENPSFEVISPLLSRCQVFVLKGLDLEDLNKILDRGLKKLDAKINKEARELLIRLSGGDARIMLNALELAGKNITTAIIQDVFQTKSAGIYDKKADEHYNTISAFIKSIRGSDPDAAIYYLCKMLESGEDPKFIARRLVILASEDVGLADRGALIQANAAFEAVTKLGLPECQLTLAHATLYLATTKKPRAVVNALEKAKQAVLDYPNEPIPLHLRNAPTKLMKQLGYADNYVWSEGYVGPNPPAGGLSFLPEKLKGKKFYEEIKP